LHSNDHDMTVDDVGRPSLAQESADLVRVARRERDDFAAASKTMQLRMTATVTARLCHDWCCRDRLDVGLEQCLVSGPDSALTSVGGDQRACVVHDHEVADRRARVRFGV
jgi:hypothetical protein